MRECEKPDRQNLLDLFSAARDTWLEIVVATRPNKPPAGAWWRSRNTITKFEWDVIVKMEMPFHLDN